MVVTSKNKAIPIILMVLGGIAIAVGIYLGLESGIFVVFFGLIFFALGMSIFKANGLVALEKEIVYIKSLNTVVLKKRTPDVRKVISIVPAKDYTISHVPEELHYASVTVGGVTTGGTYTTGGYDNISSKKNGLYEMKYGKDNSVYKIDLSDELYTEAKNSPISQYLNTMKQIVVESHDGLSEAESKSMLHNLETTGWVGNEYAKIGKPTKEKCQAILDWMCGYDLK